MPLKWHKLNMYEGLVSENDRVHTIYTVNQISDIANLMGTSPNQAMSQGQDGQSNPTSP